MSLLLVANSKGTPPPPMGAQKSGGSPVVEVYAPSWWIDDSQPPLKG